MNARKICQGLIFSEERRARLRGWGGVKPPAFATIAPYPVSRKVRDFTHPAATNLVFG